MAIVALPAFQFYQGQVTVTPWYNTANLNLDHVVCVNGRSATVSMTLVAPGLPGGSITRTFAANTTTSINVPTGGYVLATDAEGNVYYPTPFSITPG